MPNLQKKLASNLINFSVVNYTQAADILINQELSLIKNKSNLLDAYVNLEPKKRHKSIIYKAIIGSLKNHSKNREDVEDVLSEALFLLRKASLKYFETDRSFNFTAYAITFIRESIKEYRSKWNGLSGSDRNELIHTAIRIIKNKNYKSGEKLSYKEAKCLANHFNLCCKTGYKKIWQLEALHYEKKAIWKLKTNEDGKEEETCIIDNLDYIKSFNNCSENISALEVNSRQEDLENSKNIFKKFKLHLNENEKIIFEKRIYCNKEDEVKLKELSALLNISIQRISKIESQIKEKLKSFYSVENKKITDIK